MLKKVNIYPYLCFFSSITLIVMGNTFDSKAVMAQEENNSHANNYINDESIISSSITSLSLGPEFFSFLAQEIPQYLPSNWRIRLPNNLTLNYPPSLNQNDYEIQVLPLLNSGLKINILHCNVQENIENICLLGHVIIKTEQEMIARENYLKHQLEGYPITLSDSIRAYYLEGEIFGSIIWFQEGLFYQLSLPIKEKQNLFYLALSMVNSDAFDRESFEKIEAEKLQFPLDNNSNLVSEDINDNTAHLQRANPSVNSCSFEQNLSKTKEINLQETININQQNIIINLAGKTIFSETEIREILKSVEVRTNLASLNSTQIKELISEEITQLYLTNNYLNSQAFYDQTNDIIVINEGSLRAININNIDDENLRKYICDRLLLASLTPFNQLEFENQLKLLREDPLFANIEAKLSESGQGGESILDVNITPASSFKGELNFDNYSPESVGAERFKINFNWRNFAGVGDTINLSYAPTITGGSQVFEVSYTVPINPMNGTLQFRAQPSYSEVTQAPFDLLNIKAERDLYYLTYRQPLIRNPRQEFALSLGLNYQEGQTFIFNNIPTPFGFGSDDNGFSRSTVINFSQDYLSRDEKGAWLWTSQFNFGVGLFSATTNNEPIPDGHFFSWQGNIGRYQKLGDNQILLIQGILQLTPDSLLPSHQFVIGGGNSIRGYRQNARTGDNGFRFSLEDQITLVRNEGGDPLFLIAPFLDLGLVWNNGGNPNLLPSQNFLIGAGVGLQWNQFLGLKNLALRLDYGLPLIDLSDRGNNLQDNGIYFRIFNQ